MNATTRSSREAGMTLIEIVLALAVLGLMLAIAWGTIGTTISAQRTSAELQERHREVRVAMARIVQDLKGAYLSANEDAFRVEKRTLFIGKEASDVDDVRFSSMARDMLWGDANESEQTLVSYLAEEDPDSSSKTDLLRRSSRRLSNENWQQETADVDVLLRDIKKVTFEYYDNRTNEWNTSWDTTGADSRRGRLPLRVRIKIVVPEGANEITFTTQARLLLQEPLQFAN